MDKIKAVIGAIIGVIGVLLLTFSGWASAIAGITFAVSSTGGLFGTVMTSLMIMGGTFLGCLVVGGLMYTFAVYILGISETL